MNPASTSILLAVLVLATAAELVLAARLLLAAEIALLVEPVAGLWLFFFFAAGRLSLMVLYLVCIIPVHVTGLYHESYKQKNRKGSEDIYIEEHTGFNYSSLINIGKEKV